MNQDRMPLLEALIEFQKQKPAYFRIPAHRFERGIGEMLQSVPLAALDLSEAEGLDDLHDAQGVIREAQHLCADLWGSDEAWFLVNGTTCGNEAMVLSTAVEGEKIIVPRNVHKSVLMGMILSGAEPVYLNPEYLKDWKLWGAVTPEAVEEAFRRAPEAKAVFLVCPTYYGILSNLPEIAKICHAHGAALLVDEAHGSHLYFSDQYPVGAVRSGADLVAQSIHKTGGSFTQSSMLHRIGDRVPSDRIRASLHMVQSTSPSYLLMASLDSARHELAVHGKEHMEKQWELAQHVRNELKKLSGIRVLCESDAGTRGIWKIDPARIVFSARERGYSGYRLHEVLYEQSGVSCELSDEDNVVAVMTWGNTREDADRLIRTLALLPVIGQERTVIGQEYPGGEPETEERKSENRKTENTASYLPVPECVMTPRQAYFSPKQMKKIEACIGEIAGEMVVPYPPGIPILCPGERITEEVAKQILRKKADGCAFHGPRDPSLETLEVLIS